MAIDRQTDSTGVSASLETVQDLIFENKVGGVGIFLQAENEPDIARHRSFVLPNYQF